jgi:hypothetical protein
MEWGRITLTVLSIFMQVMDVIEIKIGQGEKHRVHDRCC